jgi:type III secretory pathway component EscR
MRDEHDFGFKCSIFAMGCGIFGFACWGLAMLMVSVQGHVLLPTFQFIERYCANYGRTTAEVLVAGIAISVSAWIHVKTVNRLLQEFSDHWKKSAENIERLEDRISKDCADIARDYRLRKAAEQEAEFFQKKNQTLQIRQRSSNTLIKSKRGAPHDERRRTANRTRHQAHSTAL